MRLSSYRFSDYRLPVYVVAAALVAAGATWAIDRVTAPAAKVEANAAPASSGAVRQIPITRPNVADLGDPEGKLTPVYPANPGKDLPIKDTPVIQAAKPATLAAAAPATAATTANVCNVAACAATYRSFRESDCTYQPFDGPRRVCEGAPDNAQIAAQPPSRDAGGTAPVARNRDDDELRNAERMVRRLPPPPGVDADDDPRGIVVMEAPRQRYELRRNWISEPED